MDLVHVNGVLAMLTALSESTHGTRGSMGDALQEAVHNDAEGMSWILNDAWNKAKRAKTLTLEMMNNAKTEASLS
jgi:hypothetical protein